MARKSYMDRLFARGGARLQRELKRNPWLENPYLAVVTEMPERMKKWPKGYMPGITKRYEPQPISMLRYDDKLGFRMVTPSFGGKPQSKRLTVNIMRSLGLNPLNPEKKTKERFDLMKNLALNNQILFQREQGGWMPQLMSTFAQGKNIQWMNPLKGDIIPMENIIAAMQAQSQTQPQSQLPTSPSTPTPIPTPTPTPILTPTSTPMQPSVASAVRPERRRGSLSNSLLSTQNYGNLLATGRGSSGGSFNWGWGR